MINRANLKISMVIAVLLVGLHCAIAAGGTDTYVFWPRYCSVAQTGGVAGIDETYGIEGRFELTVDFDAGTASFDVVDANLLDPSPYLDGYGTDLEELFDMTELVGTVISSTEIEFDTNNPLPGDNVVHLDVAFGDIYAPGVSVYITGGFCEAWPDGFCFEMYTRAVKKRVFYVDANATGADDGSSWENAFTDLQDALDEAHGCYGSEIWVARGTYKPDNYMCEAIPGVPQSKTFRIMDGVMMYGGFDGTESTRSERDWINNETILSGDLDNDGILDDDNVWHVVRPTDSDISRTGGIDGFTVTGGYADGFGSNGSGGGIFLHAGGATHKSPTIANCKIVDNYADVSGAGMFIEQGDPTVTNCSFTGNWAVWGGGMYNFNSSPTVTGCIFTSNSAHFDGGGMYNVDNSDPTVSNCTFIGNSVNSLGGGISNNNSNPSVTGCTFSGNAALAGGGMCNFEGNSTVTGCTFIGNSTEYGGGIYNGGGSPTVTGCIFIGNSADYGGGISNTFSSPTVTNCSFVGNSAEYGGGMEHYESNPTVTGSILWDNIASIDGNEIYNDTKSTPVISYSDIAGWNSSMGADLGGNIDIDPLFVDANGPDGTVGTEDDNLRLSAGSLCIDAGDPNYIPGPNETDLDGNARVIGGRIDIGAYELQPLTPVELLFGLTDMVDQLSLHKGISNSLLAKLDTAIDKLEDGNDKAAINLLEAFIKAVEAQRGKKISEVDADDLIEAAQEIIELLGGV